MKKLVNNKLMRVMIALGMFAFAGCQEYEIDSQPDAAANIQVDALEWYDMAAESAASVVFNISANTPWQIINDDNAQWCTVTPTMSATSGLVSEITINAEDNLSYSPRTASFTIVAPALEDFTRTILVTQASKAEFTVSEVTTTVDAAGGEVVFYITSNKAWEYVTEKDFLLDAKVEKYNPTPEGEGDGSTEGEVEGGAEGEESEGEAPATRGMGPTGPDTDESESYLLTINVPLNPGIERTGTFYIRLLNGKDEEGKDKHTRSVSQSGVELRLADDEPDPVFAGDAESGIPAYGPGATLTFNVRASIDWTVEVSEQDADWIEVVDYEVTENEKNGMPTGGWVTLATKGGINPYAGRRVGTVNLKAQGLSPVPINVYQPSPVGYRLGFNDSPDASNCCVANGDGSVTIKFGDTINETIAYLDPTGSLGSWTYEFDPERASIEQVHLYFAFAAGHTDGSSNGCRSALTPYQAADAASGITNNFIMNNHMGTFSTTPQRWNLDGVQINTFPKKEGDEALPVAAVKKLEKVTYEFGKNGMAIRIVADGKNYEAEMPLTDPDNDFENYKKAVSAYIANFRIVDPLGVKSFAGEYVTLTKFYFTPAE